MRQLFDVVHQAVELPLRINLLLSAQREAIQSLVVAEVAEHRLHRGETPPIELPAPCRIDRLPHDLGVARLTAGRLAAKEADLAGLGDVRLAQALLAVRAGLAIPQRALELHRQLAVVVAVRSVLVKPLTRWTPTGAALRVVGEVLRAVVLGALLRVRLVVERIGLGLVPGLILEAFVPAAHLLSIV